VSDKKEVRRKRTNIVKSNAVKKFPCASSVCMYGVVWGYGTLLLYHVSSIGMYVVML
jgi:hypothetical protein